MEAIPSIVCDTLHSLGLHDQAPSWKIMDSRGRITVVLQWEKEDGGQTPALPSRMISGGPSPRLLGVQSRSFSQRSVGDYSRGFLTCKAQMQPSILTYNLLTILHICM